MNEVSDGSMEVSYDKSNIDAVCVNCNKRLRSMRAISMHIRMTAARHAVNFIHYGNYDKKTGLKEMNFNLLENASHIHNTRGLEEEGEFSIQHSDGTL